MEERRHNYDTVDLLKLVGSILIFTMHASALSSFNANAQFFGVQLLALSAVVLLLQEKARLQWPKYLT